MLIFSVVIFVFSTLTLSPRPPLPRKVGGHGSPAPMGAPPLLKSNQVLACCQDFSALQVPILLHKNVGFCIKI